MHILKHENSTEVKEDLLNGVVDIVVGDGILNPSDVTDLSSGSNPLFNMILTEPLQNRIVVFNTAKPPTDDVDIRKMIINAVDKSTIVEKELGALAETVNNLFPLNAPYCNVSLVPQRGYNLSAAYNANCEPIATETTVVEITTTTLRDNIEDLSAATSEKITFFLYVAVVAVNILLLCC